MSLYVILTPQLESPQDVISPTFPWLPANFPPCDTVILFCHLLTDRCWLFLYIMVRFEYSMVHDTSRFWSNMPSSYSCAFLHVYSPLWCCSFNLEFSSKNDFLKHPVFNLLLEPYFCAQSLHSGQIWACM